LGPLRRRLPHQWPHGLVAEWTYIAPVRP
jgi:hypothetical protein